MAAPSPGRPSRLATFLGIPLAGLILTLFFIFLGFPYDQLARRLSRLVEESGTMTLRIGELSPHLGLAGPGFKASDVRTGGRPVPRLHIEEVIVRPAWSLSWLRGWPAIHVDVKSEMGGAAGTLTLGDSPGWQGELHGVELAAIPTGEAIATGTLTGRLDADLDLHWLPEVEGRRDVSGSIRFEARDGSVSSRGVPLAIPYDLMRGEVRLGGERFASIDSLNLEGPLVSAEASGTVGRGRRFEQRPLDLAISYRVESDDLKSMLRGLGMRLSPSGEGTVKVRGTFANPRTMLR